MNSPEHQKYYRPPGTPAKDHDPAKNVQVAGYINEGNPNTQEASADIENKDTEKQSSSVADDKQSAQVVKQAIKDDQGLAAVAHDIRVTVKDGVVTLDGKVVTEQQMNLATNTAAALGAIDDVNNQKLNLTKAPDELKDHPHKML